MSEGAGVIEIVCELTFPFAIEETAARAIHAVAASGTEAYRISFTKGMLAPAADIEGSGAGGAF